MYKVIQLHEIMHLKKNVTFKVKQRRTGIYIQLRHVLNSAVHVTAFEIEVDINTTAGCQQLFKLSCVIFK